MKKAKKLSIDRLWVVVAILAIAAVALFFMPASFGEVTTFAIKDKCGKFVNLIDHTIEDDEQCDIRCRQQCKAKDLKYDESFFTEAASGCNDCQCSCKTPAWR